MTWVLVSNNRGVFASGASSTTLAGSPSATIAAGNYAIVCISKDNSSTTDGDNSEVSSVTDTAGNTWTKLREYSNGSPGAGAGVTASMWGSILTTQLLTSDTITITFASAITDKCAMVREFSIDAGTTSIAVAGGDSVEVNGANGFGASTISGLVSKEYLFFRVMAKEANTTTAITATTNFTAVPGTRSRNNAAAVINRGEFRINTSTGETSDPTLAVAGDTASVFVALEEVAAGGATQPPRSMHQYRQRRAA